MGEGGCHLLVGLSHSPVLVSVTLSSSHPVATTSALVPAEKAGQHKEEDLFGESSSSEDEEDS